MSELRVVFDGPPGPESGRFVEVENEHGHSVNAGEWRERADGLWELVIVNDLSRALADTVRERDEARDALLLHVTKGLPPPLNCDAVVGAKDYERAVEHAQKAALHAQAECLKAQDAALKAQEGERVALGKRAQAMEYAEGLAVLWREWLETDIDHMDEDYEDWMTGFNARILAALAKNPNQRQGADSPYVANIDPSGEQDQHADGTSPAPPLNAPLATPIAQSAPATLSSLQMSTQTLTPDDAMRWDAINKRVLDIIYGPDAPTAAESDLVWLARRFVAAHAPESLPTFHEPPGWKLVPIVLTERMQEVAWDRLQCDVPEPDSAYQYLWDGLLAAAVGEQPPEIGTQT